MERVLPLDPVLQIECNRKGSRMIYGKYQYTFDTSKLSTCTDINDCYKRKKTSLDPSLFYQTCMEALVKMRKDKCTKHPFIIWRLNTTPRCTMQESHSISMLQGRWKMEVPNLSLIGHTIIDVEERGELKLLRSLSYNQLFIKLQWLFM